MPQHRSATTPPGLPQRRSGLMRSQSLSPPPPLCVFAHTYTPTVCDRLTHTHTHILGHQLLGWVIIGWNSNTNTKDMKSRILLVSILPTTSSSELPNRALWLKG